MHHPVSMMETLVVALLVTQTTRLPSLSILALFVSLILAERVHLLQLLQVPYLPPIHSMEIDSSSFGMIDISS